MDSRFKFINGRLLPASEADPLSDLNAIREQMRQNRSAASDQKRMMQRLRLRQNPIAFYEGSDADQGLSRAHLPNGDMRQGEAIFSSSQALGAPLRLTRQLLGTQQLDQKSNRRQQRSAQPNRLNPLDIGPVKVLFALYEGDPMSVTFYVGGHTAQPTKVITLLGNIYPQAYITNTGSGADDWIVSIVYRKPEHTHYTLLAVTATDAIAHEYTGEHAGGLAYKGAGFFDGQYYTPNNYEREKRVVGSGERATVNTNPIQSGNYITIYEYGVLVYSENNNYPSFLGHTTGTETIQITYDSSLPYLEYSGTRESATNYDSVIGRDFEFHHAYVSTEIVSTSGLTKAFSFDAVNGFQGLTGSYSKSVNVTTTLSHYDPNLQFIEPQNTLDNGYRNKNETGSKRLSSWLIKEDINDSYHIGYVPVLNNWAYTQTERLKIYNSVATGLNSAIYLQKIEDIDTTYARATQQTNENRTESFTYWLETLEGEAIALSSGFNFLPQTQSLIDQTIYEAPIDGDYRDQDKTIVVKVYTIQNGAFQRDDSKEIQATVKSLGLDPQSFNYQIFGASYYE